MGTTKEEVKANDKRTLAQSDEPLLNNYSKQKCASCGSGNTKCIYSDFAGSIIGYYLDEEYICLDCGKYTVYSLEYDS